jgi:NAD(P)-dependent dehydrogenase (short-subunit alcohol dehydrogenase family)
MVGELICSAGGRTASRVARMTQRGELDGRVAVVTGGSRGLGREIAIALSLSGSDVVVSARDCVELEQMIESIRGQSGREVLAVVADVTQPADVDRLHAETSASLGPASILVNAAGVFGPLTPFSRTNPSEWVHTLLVNTVGPYLTCRAFLPEMLAAGWGRIVNLSSAASLLTPGPLDSAYSTSKAALNRMTRHLAAEIAGTGVTANVLHPGSVKTAMWADVRDKVLLLGNEADPFRAWVERVEHTGGDPASKSVDVVLELVGRGSDRTNGAFCWPRDALDEPVASW